MIYKGNGRKYEVGNDYYKNSLEFHRFIEDEGLSGEKVLDLLLDWHGTALTSESMMVNLFHHEYGLEGEENEEA